MSKIWSEIDHDAMLRAIELSRLGFPAPNPRVGAVVVCDGKIVGEGYHEAVGLPHAEVVAIEQAGLRAQGGTLYVTLEPCNHYGRTPPCTDLIIRSGIRRVVFSNDDPNDLSGDGESKLLESDVIVEKGLLMDASFEVNKIYLTSFDLGRPYVLVKAGVSLDGRIATSTGESRWITDDEARKRAHELRAEYGCVLVGAHTVSMDNPELTVREVSCCLQPFRVILDPKRRLSDGLRVFSDDSDRTIRVTDRSLAVDDDLGCVMHDGEFDLGMLLQELGKLGVRGVLVEGGGRTIESFFRQGLVDAIELHVAPLVLGSGRVWVDGVGVSSLSESWKVSNLKVDSLGSGFRLTADVIH